MYMCILNMSQYSPKNSWHNPFLRYQKKPIHRVWGSNDIYIYIYIMCAENQKSRWKRGGVTGLVIFEGSVPNCRSYALQPSAVQACAKLYACMCMRMYMYTCKYVNMGETKRAQPRESGGMPVTHTRWSRVQCLCATSTRTHSAMAHFPRKTTTHLPRGDSRIFTTAFSTRDLYIYVHIYMNMYTYIYSCMYSRVCTCTM